MTSSELIDCTLKMCHFASMLNKLGFIGVLLKDRQVLPHLKKNPSIKSASGIFLSSAEEQIIDFYSQANCIVYYIILILLPKPERFCFSLLDVWWNCNHIMSDNSINHFNQLNTVNHPYNGPWWWGEGRGWCPLLPIVLLHRVRYQSLYK